MPKPSSGRSGRVWPRLGPATSRRRINAIPCGRNWQRWVRCSPPMSGPVEQARNEANGLAHRLHQIESSSIWRGLLPGPPNRGADPLRWHGGLRRSMKLVWWTVTPATAAPLPPVAGSPCLAAQPAHGSPVGAPRVDAGAIFGRRGSANSAAQSDAPREHPAAACAGAGRLADYLYLWAAGRDAGLSAVDRGSPRRSADRGHSCG